MATSTGSKAAAHAPVARTPELMKTESQYLGRESAVMAGNIGRGDTEDIQVTGNMDLAEREAFMRDILTIVVMGSGQDNEMPFVPVSVNGKMLHIPIGQPANVPRMHVEVLARAKRTDFSQNLDFALGERMNALQQMHSLRNQFSIVRDPSPHGGTWLMEVLAQAR